MNKLEKSLDYESFESTNAVSVCVFCAFGSHTAARGW